MKKRLLFIIMLATTSAFDADGGVLFVTFKGEATPMAQQSILA